jgi:hypothetical protein
MMGSDGPRDAAVAALLRALPPAPLPEALAGHERVLARARMLSRLASVHAAAHRGDRPLLVAGLAGSSVAALALLALLAWMWSGLTARLASRSELGMAAALGLPQLIAITLAAGLALILAIVLPLVLAED